MICIQKHTVLERKNRILNKGAILKENYKFGPSEHMESGAFESDGCGKHR